MRVPGDRRLREELVSVFDIRALSAIDADIEACCAVEDYSDEEMTRYIEERTAVEDCLDRVKALISELGLDTGQ